MPAEQPDARAVKVQDLRDQQTEFAVAEHRHGAPRGILT